MVSGIEAVKMAARFLYWIESNFVNFDLAQQFPQALCERLFQAVLVHDDLYPDARLPDDFHLNYASSQLAQCYGLCQQMWQQGSDPDTIRQIVSEITETGTLDRNGKRAFKYIRARYKHLRFAYHTYSQTHQYPTVFHLMTKLMGSIQDALNNSHHTVLNSYLLAVRLFLSRPVYALIFRDVANFKVCSTDSFQQYVFKGMDFLRHHLMRDGITRKDFHEMRKVISRLVAHYDNLKILYPSAYHEQVSQFLSTINGMMGKAHDVMTVVKLTDKKAYYHAPIELDAQIRWRLEDLVRVCDRYRASLNE